jgi:hypothetical protein
MSSWGDLPMFSSKQISQADLVGLLRFMMGSGVLLVLIFLGEVFSIADTIMVWIIISLLAIGFILMICRRLQEESEMNFFLNASREELLEYEKTHPLKELKRDTLYDDLE